MAFCRVRCRSDPCHREFPCPLPSLLRRVSAWPSLAILRRSCACLPTIERDPNHELIVAEDEEGATIAVLQLIFTPHLTHQGGWRATVEGVRVDARHRGAGLGRQLFARAIERARARGCHQLQLSTDKQRPKAKRFYEQLGFVATHEGMKLKLDLATQVVG